MMSISAHSSAIRSGCSNGAMTTAVPMRTRRVAAATAPANGASEGQIPYGEKWCSASHTTSKPSSSARRHSSSAFRYTSACVCHSRIDKRFWVENFIASDYGRTVREVNRDG